jgi:hypothetical protein
MVRIAMPRRGRKPRDPEDGLEEARRRRTEGGKETGGGVQ